MQRLDHAEVAHAKDGAALQHEGAPAKPLSRIADEVELVLRGDGRVGQAAAGRADVLLSGELAAGVVEGGAAAGAAPADLAVLPLGGDELGGGLGTVTGSGRRERGDVHDGGHVLRDVVLDQTLRAGKADIKQLWRSNIAEIPQEAAAEDVHKAVDIALPAHLPDECDAAVNQLVVVKGTRRGPPPVVTAQRYVEVLGGLGPLVVARGRDELVRPLLRLEPRLDAASNFLAARVRHSLGGHLVARGRNKNEGERGEMEDIEGSHTRTQNQNTSTRTEKREKSSDNMMKEGGGVSPECEWREWSES